MNRTSQVEERRWVSLSRACRILEVNEVTVRRWADRGLIRSYRTPGGHRRFSQEELRSLTEQSQSIWRDESTSPTVSDTTLKHIRRRLKSRTASNQHWYDQIGEDHKGRLRIFGQRLITLAADYLAHRGRRGELLAEARIVGEGQGEEAARMGLSIEDATRAFSFFRNSLLEGLQDLKSDVTSTGAGYRMWQQVNTITDEALQGMVHAYQQAGLDVGIGPAR